MEPLVLSDFTYHRHVLLVSPNEMMIRETVRRNMKSSRCVRIIV
jgi:hypothetical protein